MADFYRVNGNVGLIGDGKGFISTVAGASFIGKQPVALAGYIAGSGGAATDLTNELGVNLGVEGIMKALSSNVTVLAYQIETGTGGNISLLLEGAAGYATTDAGVATAVQNIVRNGGNGAGYYGNNNINATTSLFVNKGFKLSYT